MRKLVTVGATALTLLLLAGCGNSNKVDNGDGADKSSKVTNSSNKTSTSKEVVNGSPEKVGQWKHFADFNADGTLEKVTTYNKVIEQGDITTTLKNVKIYSMKPKDDAAKKTASSYFNASGVDSPYYVVQINWSAKNGGTKELQTNGIKSIVTNTGQQFDIGSGLQDSGTGATLAPNGSSDYEANGLLKGSTAKDINSLTVNLGSICTTDTFEDVSPEVSNIVLDVK